MGLQKPQPSSEEHPVGTARKVCWNKCKKLSTGKSGATLVSKSAAKKTQPLTEDLTAT